MLLALYALKRCKYAASGGPGLSWASSARASVRLFHEHDTFATPPAEPQLSASPFAEPAEPAEPQLKKIGVGVLDSGQYGKSPTYKSFWNAPQSTEVVPLGRSRWQIQLSYNIGIHQRLSDIKCVVKSKLGLIVCFANAPHIYKGGERSVDTDLNGILPTVHSDLLPMFHHYLLQVPNEERLLDDLKHHKIRILDLHTGLRDECHSIRTALDTYDTFMDGLRSFCFQAAYQVDHLIAQGALHPVTIPETFSGIWSRYPGVFANVDQHALCAGLEMLPGKLAKEFESSRPEEGQFPPLYATSDMLQSCIDAASADAHGMQSRTLRQRLHYFKSDYSAVYHWLDQDDFAPPPPMRTDLTSPATPANDIGEEDDVKRFMLMRRAYVTPTGIKVGKEQFELSNRVVRKYWAHRDRFLRVRFCDESLQWYPTSAQALDRAERILKEGLKACGRQYELVAFSASQLRQQSAWFFAATPDGECTAEIIRQGLGDFSKIRNPAKYFARLGQSFSATYPVRTIENIQDYVQDVDDVDNGTKYIFSDGVGRISAELARNANEALFGKKDSDEPKENRCVASAFQMRYDGYKGVVSVYPNMKSDRGMELRGSMKKFDSSGHGDLEVIRAAERMPGYLNRQFITLLSALGIEDDVFTKLQEEMIDSLKKVTQDREIALQTLYMHGCHLPNNPLNSVVDTLKSGVAPSAEPFLRKGLMALARFSLQNLRDRTSIPVQKAAILMGIMDEERVLQSGEIFIAVRNPSNGHAEFIEGDVIVGKNPCHHPGDIRKLRAVNRPELHHLVDCLVFPQVGTRPHTDECSGSDLDGDLYFVSWDPRLIPAENYEPLDYTAGVPEENNEDISDPNTMAKFFIKYLSGSSLGRISNAHLAQADKLGAKDKTCIELAKHFSCAVDFPKTGKPPRVPNSCFPVKYPDFMRPQSEHYKSEKVIGRLYRSAKGNIEEATILTPEALRMEGHWQPDQDFQHDGYASFLSEADDVLSSYSKQVGQLIEHFKVGSEAELFVGLIDPIERSEKSSRNLLELGHTYWHDLRYFAQMEANLLIRRFYKHSFLEGRISPHGDAWLAKEEHFLGKASAWYKAAVFEINESNSSANSQRHCLSFPWIAHRQLCHLKQRQQRYRQARVLVG
eukprot:scpid27037/ scgid21522/ Probable RNA-dependent RNA polymerase 1